MADSESRRLPEHPSVDQLRKQAKDLLRAWRDGDASVVERVHVHKPQAAEPVLADAQLVLAREYGFESWPKLVHHVQALHPQRLDHLESIARAFVAAYQGDAEALARLNEWFSARKNLEELRQMVQERRRLSVGEAGDVAEFRLVEARLLVAQALGFESWDKLAASLEQPATDPRTVPHGLSTRPPFYRIDWSSNTLEPRQSLADRDWDPILDVIREHGITGVDAKGQMTDGVLERLSQLDHVTRLNLGGSTRVTDNGLLHLARMPQLEELDLSEYPGGRLTDRGLEVLRHLRELRRFAMCWQAGISDVGVATLASSLCQTRRRAREVTVNAVLARRSSALTSTVAAPYFRSTRCASRRAALRALRSTPPSSGD